MLKKIYGLLKGYFFLTKDEYNLFYSYHICCIVFTLSFFLILHNCVAIQKFCIQHIAQRTEISLMTLLWSNIK